MALKALIFACDYMRYIDFIKRYGLKEAECRYVNHIDNIQGYHKDTNPDLLLIFLNHYLTYLDQFWLPRMGNADSLLHVMSEFRGQVYLTDNDIFDSGPETAAQLIQLTYITKQEQLPEYLSHENEEVRKAAKKKQGELNDLP